MVEKRARMQAFVVLAAVLLIAVYAHNYSFSPTGRVITGLDDALADLGAVKQEYNNNIEYVPNFVQTLLGDEIIHATVTRNDGSTMYIRAVSEDAALVELAEASEEPGEDVSLLITISEQTIDAIFEADDQIARLREVLDNDEIEIDAEEFITGIKVFLGNTYLMITGWF